MPNRKRIDSVSQNEAHPPSGDNEILECVPDVKLTFFNRPDGGNLVDCEREYIYDREGRLVEVRVAGPVGIYNGPRSKENVPDDWEPEE